jgi:phage tail sheath gpL-like
MGSIPSKVPSNLRTPGGYHEFDFTAGGQQLVTLDRRIVIIAEKTAAGTAVVETPIQLFGELDGDAKCGVGSMASLMNRMALLQAKLSNVGACEIWVCPVAEPAGGTATIYTITVSNPATESKDLILDINGVILTVGVNLGDAAATIATAIKNKCDEFKTSLPVTASVVGAVVSLTFNHKGTNGNGMRRVTVQTPAGVGIAHAVGTPGVGVYAPANALAALYDRRYHGVALSNHSTTDAAVLLADAALSWGFAQKNYRFYALGESGSLGTAQTLEGAFNDYRFLFSTCEGIGALPGQMAVAKLMAWMSREAPNANLDDERLALSPPSAIDAFTSAETESALASGLTPLVPDGPYVKIVRLVTTQITVSGAPFEPLREPALPRTAAYMAEQVDIGFKIGFHQEVLYDDPDSGDDILARVRDMVVDKHRAAQRAKYIRDVDTFLPQIKAEISDSVPGRIVVQDPMRVAGPLHQGAFLHTMYLS